MTAKLQQEISTIFEEMAFFLELNGENPFKIRAFQKGAEAILDTMEDIRKLAREGKLTEIPGIGKGLSAAIAEYLNTGKVLELENVRKNYPESLAEMRGVPGLGPKKIKALFDNLGIASLAELEYACNENRLIELKGFGEKTQTKIQASLQNLKANRGKVLLPKAIHSAEMIIASLEKLKSIGRVEIVGSVRRRNPVIARIDILVEWKSASIKDLEKTLSGLGIQSKSVPPEEFLVYSGELADGLPLYIYACDKTTKRSFTSLQLELTGASAFTKSLAQPIASTKATSEADFFREIKLAWIPPEARESTAPQEPLALVDLPDIKGIFHAHTTASDGAHTLEQMAEKCIELGLEYLGISEHSQSAGYAGGLKADAIARQRDEIDRLNSKYKNFRIFQGIESDIHKDGSLDYPEKILKQFDFVIASLHGQFQMPRTEMTNRVVRALENPYTTWLGHPTGRLLLGRKGADLDLDEVLATAAKYKKSLELNANPYRLDLDWELLPQAKKLGIPIGIFPDAHSTHGIADLKYGIWMARKGRLTAADVINTKSLVEMELWLKKQKS